MGGRFSVAGRLGHGRGVLALEMDNKRAATTTARQT